ncbi:MAG: nucleotidyl transferase AbiEii/AbiGii toxin family protein [Verrucomicrobiota bacterium]|nr:nucleotidyl transferase AbiEii/AbiGii toxin family protein [Verrucomicrobiota bacterium]
MSNGNLTDLQCQVLKVLAHLKVAWRLSGGGALIGAYTHHRVTRDLDLFFLESHLGDIPKMTVSLLKETGYSVSIIQNEPTFCRLKVEQKNESLVVDLVAENISPVEPPRAWVCEGTTIQVDSIHELLVTKLCALLGRSEIRDLIDLEVLLSSGGDLPKALHDAAKKDTGFSPLTLAWVLRELPVDALGQAMKLSKEEVLKLYNFRDWFLERLLEVSSP